ncbi:MAG: baseplate J/gp47 family protein, partial [Clostridia bacterium]
MRTLTDWQTYIQGKINTLLGTSGYPSADFYAGSVIDTITLMMAYLTNFTEKSIEYYKNQAWIVTADLPYLSLKAVDFGVTVDTGSKSTGTCTFSRETNTGDVTIPSGTKVAVSVELGSLQFQTTAVGTISDGDYSVDIAVESVLVGSDKNVEPTTIRYFVDAVAGVDSVENATATSGGTDGDTTE